MNSLGTTSIDSLPISPQTQNVDNNIRLETYDKPPPQQQMQQAQQQQPMQQQQQQAPIYSPTVLPMQQLMQQQPQPMMQQGPPQQQMQQQQQADPTVAQRQLNQFVTGLQQASAAGMTALPSRDIPQNQEQLARDLQMRPNYVPSPADDPNGTGDYIAYDDGPSVGDVLQRQQERDRHANHLDSVYDELQVPLFIAVLFFLFQLPVVRKQLLKYLPSLFNAEGNPTITGYMVNSGLFALTYYVLRRGMKFIEVE